MTAPGNDVLLLTLTVSILLSSAYAIGRIHQCRRYGIERDEAYRLGYDKASLSVLALMANPAKADPELGTHSRRRGRGRHARRLRMVNRSSVRPAGRGTRGHHV